MSASAASVASAATARPDRAVARGSVQRANRLYGAAFGLPLRPRRPMLACPALAPALEIVSIMLSSLTTYVMPM